MVQKEQGHHYREEGCIVDFFGTEEKRDLETEVGAGINTETDPDTVNLERYWSDPEEDRRDE